MGINLLEMSDVDDDFIDLPPSYSTLNLFHQLDEGLPPFDQVITHSFFYSWLSLVNHWYTSVRSNDIANDLRIQSTKYNRKL